VDERLIESLDDLGGVLRPPGRVLLEAAADELDERHRGVRPRD